MGTLTITYSTPGGRPMAVATVNNPDLLRQVAESALREAEESIESSKGDPVVRKLRNMEFQRLRSALGLIVPGLLAAGSIN